MRRAIAHPSRPRQLPPGFVWACYGLSAVTIACGFVLAARRYPGGFDWTYQVMSDLASRKHNPDGSRWFACALTVSLALLWPVLSSIARRAVVLDRRTKFAVFVLRTALVFGMLVGVDRLLFFHLSETVRKGHEALAVVAFVAAYIGVVSLQLSRLRQGRSSTWSVALVLVPLVAVGASLLVRYLGQRGLGWLDHDWRHDNMPLWARFALWQWLAVGGLWLAVGQLLFGAGRPAPSRRQVSVPGLEP